MLKGLPAFVENRIARILMTETPSTAQLLRRPLPLRKQILRKRSRSVDSIKIFKGTQLLYSENPLSNYLSMLQRSLKYFSLSVCCSFSIIIYIFFFFCWIRLSEEELIKEIFLRNHPVRVFFFCLHFNSVLLLLLFY